MKTVTIRLDSELICDFLNDNCTMLRDCNLVVESINSNFDVVLRGQQNNLAEFLLEMGYADYQLRELGINYDY